MSNFFHILFFLFPAFIAFGSNRHLEYTLHVRGKQTENHQNKLAILIWNDKNILLGNILIILGGEIGVFIFYYKNSIEVNYVYALITISILLIVFGFFKKLVAALKIHKNLSDE